jgi:hypothetical protein
MSRTGVDSSCTPVNSAESATGELITMSARIGTAGGGAFGEGAAGGGVGCVTVGEGSAGEGAGGGGAACVTVGEGGAGGGAAGGGAVCVTVGEGGAAREGVVGLGAADGDDDADAPLGGGSARTGAAVGTSRVVSRGGASEQAVSVSTTSARPGVRDTLRVRSKAGARAIGHDGAGGFATCPPPRSDARCAPRLLLFCGVFLTGPSFSVGLRG